METEGIEGESLESPFTYSVISRNVLASPQNNRTRYLLLSKDSLCPQNIWKLVVRGVPIANEKTWYVWWHFRLAIA